jgi:glutaredoxin 3
MSLGEEIQQQISSSKVLMYSKTWCPYCTKSKNSFGSMNIPVEVVELDLLPNGDAIQAELGRITRQTTVPNIFIAGVHVGGNSDLEAKVRSGEVIDLLERAGITV